MRHTLSLTTSALALILAAPAMAQDRGEQHTTDDFHASGSDIIVTAPFVRSLDILGNVTVVDGEELARDMRGQIGDTLVRQAGVSATSFTPGASRPVLRGFQGERVRVLVDGIGSIDVSNTSADHATTIDPLTAERIEILRGPAVLLFGSQAIGGAVNVFDRRIPRAMPESPAHVDAIGGYSTAAREWSGGASLDVPLGRQIALHVDGSYRNSGNVRTGGFVLAPALRAEVLEIAAEERAEGHADEAAEYEELAGQRGRIPNTQNETITAGAGVSIINDGGKLGFSVGYYDSHYGLPIRPGTAHAHGEEEEGHDDDHHDDHDDDHDDHDDAGHDHGDVPVTIRLKQWRADFRGEVDLGGGFLETLRVRGGFADYSHTEFEGDEVGTVFTNQGIEARMELAQADRGGWRGASGVQYSFRDFDAVGAEAFVPQNDTEQFALFTLQEYHIGRLGLETAARYEKTDTRAKSLDIVRRFNSLSGAVGLTYALDAAERSRIGINISRTVRAPSAEELFSDGPHIATSAYELGNPTFGKEKSTGGEVFAKLAGDNWSLGLTGYANWFDNFIYLDDTGVARDDLPLFVYRQQDARFWGIELEASARLFQSGGFSIGADIVADYTRARLLGGAGAVPRIPPLRLLGGLEARSAAIEARVEVEWTDDQARVAAFETPTNGFTMVNASIAWHPVANNRGITVSLAANNIFDVSARRHASFTKDFVPLAGRDIRAGVRLSF